MCFKLVLASLGPCKSLIYIGLRLAIFARFARAVTIAQNSSNIAVNGVAKKPQNECGLVDSFGS